MEKIKVLTSNGVIALYEKKYITFDELKNFDAEKIKSLMSDGVVAAYKTGVTF